MSTKLTTRLATKGKHHSLIYLAALHQRVLAALSNDPFESNRTLPEFDPESRQGTELTKGAKFTAEELRSITNCFRGCELPAWLPPAAN